jgi:uncharacterized protein HemX
MFGMLSQVRLVFTILIFLGIAGAGVYVIKLRADNEVLRANQAKLETAVQNQQALIEQQKRDYGQILKDNQQVNTLINNLNKDINDLDSKFNKGGRDLGKMAIQKPVAIETIVNNASDKALRCVEIAGGAPLTDAEKNATKKSEINSQCPSIANPKYQEYGAQ